MDMEHSLIILKDIKIRLLVSEHSVVTLPAHKILLFDYGLLNLIQQEKVILQME